MYNLGSVGCTRPNWRWFNHVTIYFPPFSDRSSFHDIPQATPDPCLFVRPADLGLHQSRFHCRDVERIQPRVGSRLACRGFAKSSCIRRRRIPELAATARHDVRIWNFLFASVLICLRSAKHQHQGPNFLAYSLSTHKVVKKLSIPGIVSFSANPNVIVIVRCSPSSCFPPS
jgi:hypothetical protein